MTDLLLSVSPWKPRRWPRGSHLHGTRVHSRAASLMAAGAPEPGKSIKDCSARTTTSGPYIVAPFEAVRLVLGSILIRSRADSGTFTKW